MIKYQNNDGVAGFQFSLGQQYIVCPTGKTVNYDCILEYTSFPNDVSWDSIQKNVQSCPSGYPANCTVITLNITGTAPDGSTITITTVIASLPVRYGGVKIVPELAKITLTLNLVAQGSNIYYAILGVAAGKSQSGSANVVKTPGGVATSVEFASTTGSTFAVSWVGDFGSSTPSSKRTATASSNVVVQSVSATDIQNYLSNCISSPLSCSGISYLMISALGAIDDFYEAFGWNIEYLFYSFPVDQLSYVYWDPCVGEGSCTSTSMGALTAPLFWLTVCMVFAHLWWSLKHM